jgi:hypothetical protein
MNISIEVPRYITHVMLSKARRAKTYKKGDTIPKKYMHYRFDAKGTLVDPQNIPVVANPRVAGTPRMKKISGQEFYKGNVHPQTRAKIIKTMKEEFLPYFLSTKPIPADMLPTHITLEIYGHTTHEQTDLDNMSWVYMKVIQDVLVEAKILPDDSLSYINQTQVCYYPVDDPEKRKMIIKLTKSEIAA